MKKNIHTFEKDGYVLIKNAIEKNICDIVTGYALFDENQNFRSERTQGMPLQVPDAHSAYADPLMESLLLYMQNIVENNTGLNIFPTYSYYRVYRNGDILKPHTDRESCEISVTSCFGYSYDDEKYSWPIIIDNKKINMFPGDIVIYKGVELEHSRDSFMPQNDEWHVQSFFHYVDAEGPYSEYKYDGRQHIGQTTPRQKRYIIRTK